MSASSRFPHRWFAGLALAVAAALAQAADTWSLPPAGSTLIGETRIEYAKQEDTFIDIAQRNGLGYDEIVAANPGVDRWLPGEGTPVILPLQHILPDAPREGIVVNLPEMRLYYFPRGQNVVKSYAISIGRMDWHSPLGRTLITAKVVNPTWTPPASIKAEHLAKGEPLPDVVPGGPDNPLGTRAMRLGLPGYLIHGTNNPNGIGMRVTHGCIRMYPDDIERLFPEVPVKTPVTLVNQTAKLGWQNGVLYLEYHSPLEEDEVPTQQQIDETVQLIHSKIGDRVQLVSPDIVQTVVRQASGMPVAISVPVAIDPSQLPPAGEPVPPVYVPGQGAPAPLAPPAPPAPTLPPPAAAPTRAVPPAAGAPVQALAPAARQSVTIVPAGRRPAPVAEKPAAPAVKAPALASAPKPATVAPRTAGKTVVAKPATVAGKPPAAAAKPVVVARAAPARPAAARTTPPAKVTPVKAAGTTTPAKATTSPAKATTAPAKTTTAPVKPAKPADAKDAGSHTKDAKHPTTTAQR